jgi:hypothetical protein
MRGEKRSRWGASERRRVGRVAAARLSGI